MLKKYFILLTFIFHTNFMLIASEVQEQSYWQRFKDWISNAQPYAQSMIAVPYEAVRDSVNELQTHEKIGIGAGLTAAAGTFLYQNYYKNEKFGEAATMAFLATYVTTPVSMLAYGMTSQYLQAVKIKHAINKLQSELRNYEKYPTQQSKIDALITIRHSLSNENHENIIPILAVNIVLDEETTLATLKNLLQAYNKTGRLFYHEVYDFGTKMIRRYRKAINLENTIQNMSLDLNDANFTLSFKISTLTFILQKNSFTKETHPNIITRQAASILLEKMLKKYLF